MRLPSCPSQALDHAHLKTSGNLLKADGAPSPLIRADIVDKYILQAFLNHSRPLCRDG